MTEKRAIVLFDAGCNLCNGAAKFIKKWDKTNGIVTIPQQSEEGIKHLNRHATFAGDSIALIRDDKIFLESEAVIELSKLLYFPWSLAIILKLIPLRFRNRMYRFVAQNRYSWFGKKENNCACKIG